MDVPVHQRSYGQRARRHPHPLARRLLQIMDRKRTNLAVSVDVTKKADLLRIVEAVADLVCIVKTHIDIVEDFDAELVAKLTALSEAHDFLIFEDRKFADIGNTVKLQYEAGVYRISSWAHLTNAHPVPGDGVVQGLASVGQPLGRGLLLLAEMSSQGALTTGAYTDEAVNMARRHRDFVMGFISQRRLEGVGLAPNDQQGETEDFLVLSPGVGLAAAGDAMGQIYRTPAEVVGHSGADCIIVGRGIYGDGNLSAEEMTRRAGEYKQAGWRAYTRRLAPM